MFANKINPATGNPVCMCGQDCLPNVPGQPSDNDIVQGSKGLVILHTACIEAHNRNLR